MNKEEIEKYIKSLISKATDVNVYNDNANQSSCYPYIVIDSSKIDTNDFPKVNIELEINIWDKHNSYKTVNQIADDIQNYLNHENHTNENIIGTFYMNIRNNLPDVDKALKRCLMQFDIELYFLKED